MNIPRLYVVDVDRINAAWHRGFAIGWAAGAIVTGLVSGAAVIFFR